MPDEHPLVIRFGAFGDMVMITSLLDRLTQRCGMPCDVVGTGNWTRTMYQHLPFVRNVYTIKSRSAPYFLSGDKQKLVKTIRQHDYRYVWLLETNNNSLKLAKRAGITHSINPIDFPRGTDEQTTEHWFRLANETPEGFGFPRDDSRACDTYLTASEEEIDKCRVWLTNRDIEPDSRIVCIQAGNKKTMKFGRKDRNSNTKYWHQRNWAAVIDAIHANDPDTQVLLCGVPAELAMTRDIRELCADKQRTHCVADELPMRRLFSLLSIADSCISVDTGPAHASAALGCNTTILYAKADARMCSPITTDARVERLYGRIPGSELGEGPASWADAHDIKLIEPETVYDAWCRSTAQD